VTDVEVAGHDVDELSQPLQWRPDQPRPVGRLRGDQVVDFAVAAAAGVHVVLLLRVLLDWDDLLGSALLAWVATLLFHYLLTRARETHEVAVDGLVTTTMWSIGFAVCGMLGWMVTFVFVKGFRQLSWTFLTSDLRTVGAADEGGGVFHGIVGTLMQVGLAVILVVPIGILTAVYLNEIGGRLTMLIRFFVDSLAGLPSILAGLLIITIFGFPQVGWKGSVALAVLTLPIMTRTSEEILKTVPDALREASLALGAPQWKVVLRVVLPTARDGLLTAAILVVARAAGETAAILLTTGFAGATNWNPFSGTQMGLPYVVFDLIKKPNQTQINRAWGGALVLLMLVLVLFVAARFTAARSARRLGRR
jgi:phosphate transport system permease protein